MIDKNYERSVPTARVLAYVKEYYPDGPRKLVELKGIKSVNTTLTMTGMGSATITVSNFKGSFIRYVPYSSVVWNTTENFAIMNTKGPDYMASLSKEHSEFYKLWRGAVLNRGDESIFKKSTFGQDRYSDNADVNSKEIWDNLISYAYPYVDLFDLIFVDYLGQDGFWYAGFTGLVSRVSDNYAISGDQSLTIQCKDYNVLFDNVSLVTSFNRLKVAEQQNEILSAFTYSTDAQMDSSRKGYQNIFFEYKTIEEVILAIVRRAQDMWRLDILQDDSIGVKGILFDTTKTYEYTGISSRRGSIWNPNIDGNIDEMDPEIFKENYDLYKVHYMFDKDFEFSDEKVGYYTNEEGNKRLSNGPGDKKILLDPVIKQLDQVFLHKMLRTSFALFNDSKRSADDMFTEMISKIMGYKYFDANGNLVFELPKYNAFPNLSEYGGRSSAVAIRHKGVKFSEGIIINDDNGDQVRPKESVKLNQDDADYNASTIWFHGKNYVPSPDDFISFNTSIDEGSLVTKTSMAAEYPRVESSEQFKGSVSALYGISAASFDLMAKLGIREFQTQNLYNIMWKNKEMGSRILSYLSASVLSRVNSLADAGTIQISQRPELQLGRTFINPLRMKLYLIMSITNSWSVGSSHTTTLNVSFGHPVYQTLEQAWTAMLSEPNLFGSLSDLGEMWITKDDGAPSPDNELTKPLELEQVKDY